MFGRKILLATFVTMLATVSCGNASFFGGGSGTKKTVPVGTNPNGTKPNGTNPNGTNPNGTNPNGTNPNGTNPNGTNPNGTNPNGTNPNGTNPNGTNPSGTNPSGSNPSSSNPNGNNCNGQPCQPQIGPNSQVTQPTPNSVVFGHDQVFHIGDGKFDNSSCRRQVAALPLTGNAYFFQFEVLNDNTAVQVNVGSICGVDYPTNTFAIFAGQAMMQSRSLPMLALQFAGTSTVLNKGIYDVVLASGFGHDHGDPVGDFDDFIVGNVTIAGSNAVRPIKYGSFVRTP